MKNLFGIFDASGCVHGQWETKNFYVIAQVLFETHDAYRNIYIYIPIYIYI